MFWPTESVAEPITTHWMNYQDRYATWDEAISGHFEACKWLRAPVEDEPDVWVKGLFKSEKRDV